MKSLILGIFIGAGLMLLGGAISLKIYLNEKLNSQNHFKVNLSQVLKNTHGIGSKLHESIMDSIDEIMGDA